MASIAVEVDPQYARIRVTVTSAVEAVVNVTRTGTNNIPVPVRNLDPGEPVGGTIEVYDYEADLNQPVYYTVTDGAVKTNSSTVTLSVSVPWLKAPFFPTLNTPIQFTTVPNFTRERPQGIHRVLGRADPVVASGTLSSRQGTLELLTVNQDAGDALAALLTTTTTVLLQMPGSRYSQMWFALGNVSEAPISKLLIEDAVRWTIEGVEVVRPSGALTGNPTATYDSLRTGVATYDVLRTTKATYTAVLRGVGAPILPPDPGGF